MLEASWELPQLVPHLCSLNRVADPSSPESECLHSYSHAWKRYISQNILSRHAHRIIVQFMAACCGKSKTTDLHTEDAGAAETKECPPNDLLLSQVHHLIDDLGKSVPLLVKALSLIHI